MHDGRPPDHARVTLSMPPIRPGWLTRLANRLRLRRTELLAALWTTGIGAPMTATAVILATVPVPQEPGHPFDPTPGGPTIATSIAAEPPSPEPRAVRTAPRTAPRIVVAPEPARPSRTATAAPTATLEPAPATTEATAEPTPSPEPPETSDTRTVEPSPTPTG
jgi:hypothetical protein